MNHQAGALQHGARRDHFVGAFQRIPDDTRKGSEGKVNGDDADRALLGLLLREVYDAGGDGEFMHDGVGEMRRGQPGRD